MQQNRQVAIWLMVGVVMTVIQIALGGITRLSGSGLSITEWEVITGTLPPMNVADWQAEFDLYKATPQYQLLNSDFTLSDFKFIYFWEWFHRLWARLLGLVFAVGFTYFLVTRKFNRTMVLPLVMLFVLGGLQGAIGWIMVQSGLEGDAVYVRPTRLALHFLFAMGLLCYTWWFALQLWVGQAGKVSGPQLARWLPLLLLLVVVQLGYGALMAGHKAATAAPTWPDINGYLLNPPNLYKPAEGWLNWIDNKIAIHTIHRGLAYLLLVSLVWFARSLWRQGAGVPFARRTAQAIGILVSLQVVLGIFTVLKSTGIMPNVWGGYEWLALLHQLTGMSLLLAVVSAAYALRAKAGTPSLA